MGVKDKQASTNGMPLGVKGSPKHGGKRHDSRKSGKK